MKNKEAAGTLNFTAIFILVRESITLLYLYAQEHESDQYALMHWDYHKPDFATPYALSIFLLLSAAALLGKDKKLGIAVVWIFFAIATAYQFIGQPFEVFPFITIPIIFIALLIGSIQILPQDKKDVLRNEFMEKKD
jgi:hypothetical protein